nr:MAG TPA: S64, SPIDER VENOM PEPTIDE, ICK [Caudoviricetes sp.]
MNPLPKACECWCCARCMKIGIRKAPRRVPVKFIY